MNKITRSMKAQLACLAAIVMVAGVFFVAPKDTRAAETVEIPNAKTDIRYVKWDKDKCELGTDTPPTYTLNSTDSYGYLFGGWFTKKDNEYVPIETADDKTAAGDEIYAKFVPSYVLSVKCQNYAGTMEGSDTTNMRVASSIDSKNYQHVGFDFKIMRKQDNGTMKVWTLGENGKQYTIKTYLGIKMFSPADITQEEPTIYRPDDIFGPASKYIVGWNLTNIQNEDFSQIIYIKPYWTTMDGTKVYGLAKYAHVEDGYFEYINVPINIKDAQEVLAGTLQVKYDPAKFEFVDAERGRVFQDMAARAEVNGSSAVVRCAGVVRDITKSKAANDIYMNLRFKAKTGTTFAGKEIHDFKIEEVEFGKLNGTTEEKLESYDVWKVHAGFLKYQEE